ncbi:hypothetical protein FGG08_003807 [Glutinoglossum americanum]|uniref:Uncharacterized protein n=1 Tax=Glutinoglossum americanum TaxID=1670608 RepID=A0A9P8I1V1_9PEZI|nr:hypothetical protein FGG08_003807 [Glutinoglossum americanum]
MSGGSSAAPRLPSAQGRIAWHAILGALALPAAELNDATSNLLQECLDSGNTFDECSVAAPITKRDGDDTDFTPFHDCLDSGKSFDECRLAVPVTKRDGGDSDFTLFGDCLDSGKSFDECRKAQGLMARSDAMLAERDLDTLAEYGRTWGGRSICYLSNHHHWLTNTAVKIAAKACEEALKKTTVGIFTKTMSGFFDALAGPVVKPKVKFILSTYVQQKTGVDFNPDTVGRDLCVKGVEHLVSDKGCNTAKKVAGITHHTAANGGIFDWTIDGKAPAYGSDGVCSNCILSMVLET